LPQPPSIRHLVARFQSQCRFQGTDSPSASDQGLWVNIAKKLLLNVMGSVVLSHVQKSKKGAPTNQPLTEQWRASRWNGRTSSALHNVRREVSVILCIFREYELYDCDTS
jgi:hypothetical protein